MTTGRELDPQHLQKLLQMMASLDTTVANRAGAEVCAAYLPILRRYSRIYGSEEDAVQDTMMEVLKSPLAFHGQSKYSTYLIAILINKLRDGNRAQRRHLADDIATLEETLVDQSPWGNPEATAESAKTETHYQKCLSKLTTLQRQVMFYCRDNALPDAEVARQLDCPVGTVKSRYSSARQALRKCLASWRREMGHA